MHAVTFSVSRVSLLLLEQPRARGRPPEELMEKLKQSFSMKIIKLLDIISHTAKNVHLSAENHDENMETKSFNRK